MHCFHTLFSDFEIWWLAISLPVEVGKCYIPQKKALLPIAWKKFWNWRNFCHERPQMSFSKGSAFSLKGACQSPGRIGLIKKVETLNFSKMACSDLESNFVWSNCIKCIPLRLFPYWQVPKSNLMAILNRVYGSWLNLRISSLSTKKPRPWCLKSTSQQSYGSWGGTEIWSSNPDFRFVVNQGCYWNSSIPNW